MGFVFISYSRNDTEIVDHVVSRLRSDGFEVWIDRESIKGGDLWRKQIVRAIHTTDAFVLMLSPNSTASKNVRKEVDLAENANRTLVPFLLAAVELPEELQYQLIGIQWIEFYKNPQEKYQELVEVLSANRKALLPEAAPETRQVEVVLPVKDMKKFDATQQEALLNFIARKVETPRSELKLVNLTAGSVHAFVEMPAEAAYSLKTDALNRDPGLLKRGIEAVRLDGEENYVLVKTGDIGPLHINPPPSFFSPLLLTLIGIVLVAVTLIAVTPGLSAYFNPPTLTPTRTSTATPSKTPTPSQTPTLTDTFTASPVPNLPPLAPEVVNPYNDLRVQCASVRRIALDWNEPFDENGIERYRVVLDVNIREQWVNMFDREVPADPTELDITKEFLDRCGNWMRWRVQAMDTTGLWGAWSEEPVFLGEKVQILIPRFNFPPPAPEIVSPQDETSVFCNSGTVLLDWQAVKDSDGISSYEVELYQSVNNEWIWLWTAPMNGSVTELDITKEVNIYCGSWLRWRVRAQDGLGEWGGWSSQPRFWTQPIPQ